MKIAHNIREKHSFLSEFLKVIWPEEKIAHLEADGIEYQLYSQTIKRLEKLIPILKKSNRTSSMNFPNFRL